MPKAEVEPLSAVLRVWEDESASFGEPYNWACTVRYLNQTTVELCGATKGLTIPIRRAIKAKLRELGINLVVIYRRRQGKLLRREIDISSP